MIPAFLASLIVVATAFADPSVPGAVDQVHFSGSLVRPVERPGSTLTLDRSGVRALALQYQPSLADSRAAIAAAQAEVTQSRLYPNPQINVEGEEVPSDFSVGSALLMTTINQSIITNGKRGWRQRIATAGVRRAAHLYEQAALEVVRDATKAYYDWLGATRRLVIARELSAIADDFETRVKLRVDGGVARPIEADRALVFATQSRMDIRRIAADQTIARQALARAVGVDHSRLTTGPIGSLEHKGELPPFDSLVVLAYQRSPAMQVPVVEEEVAQNELALGRALRVPDIEVGLGVQHRRMEGASHDLRGFQLTVPIPVFNNGQADRERARALIAGAKSRQSQARQSLRSRLTAAYETGRRTHDQLEAYLHQVLPAARRAVATSLEGYKAGEFSYLEVLDAQRSLASTTQSYFETLVDYQKSRADLEEIVAGEVVELPEHGDDHEEPR